MVILRLAGIWLIGFLEDDEDLKCCEIRFFNWESGILTLRSFESCEDCDDIDGVRLPRLGLSPDSLCMDIFFGS